jgi:nucleotide-binding universal stress UspA family protein
MTDPVVLIVLDGSQHALAAQPVARRLAELTKAPLRTLHATAPAGPAPAELRGAGLIVTCAEAADIETGGALVDAVLHGAACPVVLVNPSQAPGDWTLKRLVALHDGSPSASDALRPAAELARATGAEFVVLHAAHERALETGSMAAPIYIDQLQHAWPVWSEEFLARLGCICPLADVQVRLRLRHGHPADEMVHVAKEESADLIVLAWKGRWEASHASTLKTVLQGAPCPVMVTCAPAA